MGRKSQNVIKRYTDMKGGYEGDMGPVDHESEVRFQKGIATRTRGRALPNHSKLGGLLPLLYSSEKPPC